VGFFSKLRGKKEAPEPPKPIEEPPAALIVLRHGMSVPSDEYVATVIASALPDGALSVPRAGLSQPSWFKTAEIAESAAANAAEALGPKLGLAEPSHRHRLLEGPDGARVMLIELRR
jgi:hypothetical protein